MKMWREEQGEGMGGVAAESVWETKEKMIVAVNDNSDCVVQDEESGEVF